MGKRVIILGASGFIGSYVTKSFLSDRIFEVKSFSSNDCNLLSAEQIENSLSFVLEDDVIIMASAITRLRENTFDSMVKNIQMAENISKFIEKRRVGYFVFLSSVDVYGLLDGMVIINEKLLPNPNDYYALSKLASEFILKKTCNKNNIPVLILRLSGVYGTGRQDKTTINKLIESATRYKEVVLYGNGEDKRDYVYIDDLYRIIKKAVEKRVNATVNIATGNSCSISGIVEIIKEKCAKTFDVKYKKRESNAEERVKDMVYDISLQKKFFPEIVMKDIRDGISDIFLKQQ